MKCKNHCFNIFILSTFLLLNINCVVASQSDDVDKIIQLINQQHGRQAYEFATGKLVEYEGEPAFDYAFGLAAQAVQQYHQAIFALERVVKQLPYLHRARYALAANYFAIGNLSAAKREFEQLLNAEQVSEYPKITEYLHVIAVRENQVNGRFENTVQLGVGHDSNANSGIEDEVILVPQLGVVELFSSSRELADSFIQAQWQTTYIKPVNMKTSWYGVGKIQLSDYQDSSEMSRLYGDIFVGWQSRQEVFKYHVNGFFRPIWLDQKKYLDYFGLSVDGSYVIDNQQEAGAVFLIARQDYQTDDFDKNQGMLSLWYSKKYANISHRWTIISGVEHSDSSQFTHLGRKYWGISYKAASKVSKMLTVDGQLDYISSGYKKDHPLFVDVRDDTLWKLTLNSQYQLSNQWSWLMKLTYLDNNSNLSLYEYDRAIAWTSILAL